ncbi:DUF2793 domain-containing protein [Chelatococcus sp. SYSU_G07232]|uniref:DUF2793 domain-containing protein n=1 Tax=Chelatococcus albus TaxID=3047466 RepID=A0ABT7AI27_9HYPH|nr:DUF2793 domain-containing protein [Chelatococcus sp. SYSU_G07232]MDJ1159018.1 DUF2793 domain-containing protein [Chelatococcus sp. SYSU_G07232]
MTETRNLGLPLLAAAQAQKHVTHNEALVALDDLVHLSVEDRDLPAPPPEAAEGGRWIVAEGASGPWSGRRGEIAVRRDGAWRFHTPEKGWRAFVRDEAVLLVFDGVAWVPLTGRALQNLDRLGLGTAADAANPFSAKLNDLLVTARGTGEGGTGDLRCKLNKEGPGQVLSLLFQSGYGARAEIGLIGDDDLSFKVSPDGATWHEALRLSAATGRLALLPGGLTGGGRLTACRWITVSGTWERPAGVRFALVFALGAGGGGGGAAGAAEAGACGGGGGAGGLSLRLLDVTTLASVPVAVGAGGAGGATTGGDGGAGGETRFGPHAVAGGGQGGRGQAAGGFARAVPGGLGGTAGGGDLNAEGGAGAPGLRLDAGNGVSGNGAPSFLGGGARGQVGNAPGGPGVARGDGGSGGCVANSATGQPGGRGADGAVWIWEFE